MYKTIFLKENEKDIFQALKSQGIKTKVFEHRLAELFNRVYNNYVGYYVFKQDGIVYKMIVLPKTIEASDSAEKEFVDYLLHYYRVKNSYNLDKERNITNSLLQLAFESNNSKDTSHDFLEEFQSHRYMAILQNIEDFFRRHKNSKRIKQDYVSQSIKYKLNLKHNIKELDKTKIHQTQSKDMAFSSLATATYYALKLFLVQKYSGTHGDMLFKKVKKVQSLLLKKYPIDKGYKFSLATLQSIKLAKLFSGKNESKQLLVDIKSLFGFEQMYKDNITSIEHRQDLTTTSLFINPSNFYEWYVYDILKKYADANGKTIQFDKLKDKKSTATKYHLNEESKSSNPDFIISDNENNMKIVIDAKWKNVNEFGDIKPSDYLKLKFDTFLLEKQGYGVVPYLVYPHIKIEEKQFTMTLKESSIFNFHTLEVDMEFEKHVNNIAFDFDIQKLQENIEEEEKKQGIKLSATESTSVIQLKRDNVVHELIEAESQEDKEKLGGLFDDALWIENEKLTKSLNTEIVLDEVKEILSEFSNIMEDESITFIKSTSTIYAHYKDEKSVVFDFSMPGSGLWKLIEVELNTSFIWQLRILSSVCNNKNAWNKICKQNAKIYQDLDNGKKVPLSVSDKKDKSKLQSVMLGGINLLLEDESTVNEFHTYFSEYEDDLYFMQNVLPDIIVRVTTFRNEHAHIKSMSKNIFDELWDLLFKKDDTDKNVLQKLLIFKRNMKVYIHDR